jgi:hypothetical protein
LPCPRDSDTLETTGCVLPLNVIESTLTAIRSRPLNLPERRTFTTLNWTGAPRGIRIAPFGAVMGSARLPRNLAPGCVDFTLIGSIVLTRSGAPAGIVWACAIVPNGIDKLNKTAEVSKELFIRTSLLLFQTGFAGGKVLLKGYEGSIPFDELTLFR